jgi:UDP-N-acetylmuramate dehydrogenase
MVQLQASIKQHNTFGLDVRAAALASFSTAAALRALLHAHEWAHMPRLVLGGGSNVLFTADWPGLVLLNRVPGIHVVRENEEEVLVRSGAGVVWHDLVQYTVGNNWGGLENLSLIPGCVGAAPIQNIGAYGTEVKDHFHSLEALQLENGEVVTFDRNACGFGYRDSFFKQEGKDRFIILHVTFRLAKHPRVNVSYGGIDNELAARGLDAPTIADVSDVVVAIRRSKLPDPAKLGNAGSFFKNPVVPIEHAERIRAEYPDLVAYAAPNGLTKLAAGWLIERAGWKGYRANDHGVHERQALVLVNYGSATGKDLLELSTNIMMSVREKFGVLLEREVNIIPAPL